MRRVGALHWSPHASYAFERVPIFSFQQLHIPIPQPAEAAEEHSAPHRLRASCYSSRRSYTSMSSMQTASRKFHATAATQDPIAQLSAIFGDTVAKQIAEKNKLALRVVDIPGKFAVLVEAMGGGTTGENRAKKIVLQNITVLDVADIEGRFGELTAIMGGDEERARGVLQQSPTVLMSADIEGHFGVLTYNSLMQLFVKEGALLPPALMSFT